MRALKENPEHTHPPAGSGGRSSLPAPAFLSTVSAWPPLTFPVSLSYGVLPVSPYTCYLSPCAYSKSRGHVNRPEISHSEGKRCIALVNLIAGLIAYSLQPKKPSLGISRNALSPIATA